jgi:hypothetical protein
VNITIQGIPATVRVIRAKYYPPDPVADNDIDFYGGWDIDYDICDRNGRLANWLLAKMTDEDFRRVEETIMENTDVRPAHRAPPR